MKIRAYFNAYYTCLELKKTVLKKASYMCNRQKVTYICNIFSGMLKYLLNKL